MTCSCGSCEVLSDDVRCSECFDRLSAPTQEKVRNYYSGSTVSRDSEPSYISFEKFLEKVEAVYDKCESAAQKEERITYNEAYENIFSSRGSYVLGAVSTIEYEAGRPLLTSLVVDEDSRKPGEGYYKLASNLGTAPGITDWSEEKKQDWWQRELEEVYHTWTGVS